ncbi:MAG: 50S ribosomal protein L35 [Eubacteriales bacterium]
MGKIKTHKASAKRFSFTATGKIKMNHTGRRHKLGLKTPKRKRQLRKKGYVSEARMDDLKRLLPYS